MEGLVKRLGVRTVGQKFLSVCFSKVSPSNTFHTHFPFLLQSWANPWANTLIPRGKAWDVYFNKLLRVSYSPKLGNCCLPWELQTP